MDRTCRSGSRRCLALLGGLLACSGAAFATSQPVTATHGPARAQANLDFRIVIPETVRLGTAVAVADPPRIFVSRTEHVAADRRVVTVAKP